ncbi:MAG: hypothetical protein BYD32DRAFT_46011 [Podila humilis]|nr:MAG: hypothetical protein BYD32DRAFT_46011 [Podila humilis]
MLLLLHLPLFTPTPVVLPIPRQLLPPQSLFALVLPMLQPSSLQQTLSELESAHQFLVQRPERHHLDRHRSVRLLGNFNMLQGVRLGVQAHVLQAIDTLAVQFMDMSSLELLKHRLPWPQEHINLVHHVGRGPGRQTQARLGDTRLTMALAMAIGMHILTILLIAKMIDASDLVAHKQVAVRGVLGIVKELGDQSLMHTHREPDGRLHVVHECASGYVSGGRGWSERACHGSGACPRTTSRSVPAAAATYNPCMTLGP